MSTIIFLLFFIINITFTINDKIFPSIPGDDIINYKIISNNSLINNLTCSNECYAGCTVQYYEIVEQKFCIRNICKCPENNKYEKQKKINEDKIFEENENFMFYLYYYFIVLLAFIYENIISMFFSNKINKIKNLYCNDNKENNKLNKKVYTFEDDDELSELLI